MTARLLLLLALSAVAGAAAEDRFPRPEFTSDYRIPSLQVPAARSDLLAYADVLYLAAALAAGTWLAVRRRSRAGILLLTVISVLYLGFFRRGCVCPVGSLQNVLYAFVDPSYAVPIPVLVFFALPLVFALLGGRVFCGGVCPLGAIQDLVLVRPARLPGWLAGSLGLLPPVYLGLAVLSVATGGDFLICRFDPFVGFFRFTAELDMAIAGSAVLAVATVVARPYCRFLCPYSVLLKLASRLSWRHLTTTPGECVDCALCVKACPFGAVETPRVPGSLFDGPRTSRRLVLLLAAVPLAAAVGAAVGYRVHPQAALMHPTVRVARSVVLDDTKGEAFLTSGKTREQLFAEAAAVTAEYGAATAALGAYVGLVFAGAAAATMIRRPRAHYAPHRAHCLSCGRCIAACPKEQEVRKARLADRERRILATVAVGGAPDARA